jgi:hypothetical protein
MMDAASDDMRVRVEALLQNGAAVVPPGVCARDAKGSVPCTHGTVAKRSPEKPGRLDGEAPCMMGVGKESLQEISSHPLRLGKTKKIVAYTKLLA